MTEWTRESLDAIRGDAVWRIKAETKLPYDTVATVVRAFIEDVLALASQPERVECELPHRKNAAGRLITGRWENAEGVNFCFGCGQSLKGDTDD